MNKVKVQQNDFVFNLKKKKNIKKNKTLSKKREEKRREEKRKLDYEVEDKYIIKKGSWL